MREELKLSNDYAIGGVVGGFAEYFGLDSTMLRIIVFLFTLLSGVFVMTIIYFGLYMWLKSKEKSSDKVIFSDNEAGIKFDKKLEEDDNEKDN